MKHHKIKPLILITLITGGSLSLFPKKSEAQSIEPDKSIENKKVEVVWEKLKKQRNELESLSREKGVGLHESMPEADFMGKFPNLLYGKQANSRIIPELTEGSAVGELRVAYLPKNLQRGNRPYCIVGLLLDLDGKCITQKIDPDTPETRQILNIGVEWEDAQKVSDYPKIIQR